jgi:multidrug efflux pump subunit AcrB
VTRLRDVARVELGAQDYSASAATSNGKRGVGIAIIQQPGSNALGTAKQCRRRDGEAIKANLPPA